MVAKLIDSVLSFPEVSQIILTCNIPERLVLPTDPRLVEVHNSSPKGFAENQNSAFTRCNQPVFCPLNPDVELKDNPFPVLLEALERSGVAMVAPLVKTPLGNIEDSVRHFPTFRSLVNKAIFGADGRYEIQEGDEEFSPEWVAGILMLFRSSDFIHLGGFDERFYLYYEDIDICARAWKHGMSIVVCPHVSVIHDARRDSRHSFYHFRWHIISMARYFYKHWGRLPRVPPARK
jgi:N-acetylglucosaminyl-diphospho-decaprenol L-rhamnosyltransferase